MKMRRICYFHVVIFMPLTAFIFCYACSTYLGYDLIDVQEKPIRDVIKTHPVSDLLITVSKDPSPDDSTIEISVRAMASRDIRVKKDIKRVKKKKYLRYNPLNKLGEFFLSAFLNFPSTPILLMFIEATATDHPPQRPFIITPIDFIARIFGDYGFHGRVPVEPHYAEYPPGYLTRLSHNLLTGLINPFQCVLVGKVKAVEQTEHLTIDTKTEVENVQLSASGITISLSMHEGIPPITAEADSHGTALLDLFPLHDHLRPHTRTKLMLAASMGELQESLELTYKTDDILPAALVAQYDAQLAKAESTPSAPQYPGTPVAISKPTPDYAEIPIPKRAQTALIIGINAYTYCPPLQNAVSDAKEVAEILSRNYGFDKVETLFDAQATRRGIIQKIREIVGGLEEGEKLLIYYAGHGYYDEILHEGYWIPVDAISIGNYLSNAEMHKYIAAMEKAQHVFLVVDSCFAGAFLERSGRDLMIRPKDREDLMNFFCKIDARKSRIVLTSGSNEPVPDEGREGHSVFAYYFLRALESPDEPIFTAGEIALRVQRAVGHNAPQMPLFGTLKNAGHEEGGFVFVRRK